jgi:hypothetical protein
MTWPAISVRLQTKDMAPPKAIPQHAEKVVGVEERHTARRARGIA